MTMASGSRVLLFAGQKGSLHALFLQPEHDDDIDSSNASFQVMVWVYSHGADIAGHQCAWRYDPDLGNTKGIESGNL
jgi:hypothetical protein